MQVKLATRQCDYCGKDYTTTLGNLKSGKGLYCSKICAKKARLGSKVAQSRREDKYSVKYKSWQTMED